MKDSRIQFCIGLFIAISAIPGNLIAQNNAESGKAFNAQQRSIVRVAVYTSTGDLQPLKSALNEGLDAGVTINEIEVE